MIGPRALRGSERGPWGRVPARRPSRRSAALFRLTAPAQVTSFSPAQFPETGGDTVRVIGTGFADSDQLVCRFGQGRVSRALWRSPEALDCAVPPQEPGSVKLHISNNNQHPWRKRLYVFECYCMKPEKKWNDGKVWWRMVCRREEENKRV